MFFAMDAARGFALHTVLPWTTRSGLLPRSSLRSPLVTPSQSICREFFL